MFQIVPTDLIGGESPASVPQTTPYLKTETPPDAESTQSFLRPSPHTQSQWLRNRSNAASRGSALMSRDAEINQM